MGSAGAGNLPNGDANNNAAPVGDGNNNNNNFDPNLPEELRGKTPGEIAKFYQDREVQYAGRIDELERAAKQPEPSNNNTTPVEPSSSEWWNDPNKAVKTVAVSREEFNQASESVQRNMIIVARMEAARRFKSDWDKWEGKVNQLMNTVPIHLRTDPEQWATAYYYVKGNSYDGDVKEAEKRGLKMGSEPPTSPTPPKDVKDEKLTKEQNYVADHLGMTEAKFKEGIKNERENNWPIVFDTRKKKG